MTFLSLSEEEQKQQWTYIAQEAIAAYRFSQPKLRWLSYTHNAVFQVNDANRRYILRLQPDVIVHESRLLSELLILQYISKNSELVVPDPIANRLGNLFTIVTVDSDAGTIFATVFSHVPGEIVDASVVSTQAMFAIGAFLAYFHTILRQFSPPLIFDRPRLDWEGLFGTESPYYVENEEEIFTPEQRRIFAEVAGEIRNTMERLGEDDTIFGLIHSDLLAKNIIENNGNIHVLDFEYCGWGYYLYDLTPLLWQLKSLRADYSDLVDAMWDGYSSVSPSLEKCKNLLETFIAGRQLASCRWVANNLTNPAVKPVAHDLIMQRTDELIGFLNTGVLKRKSITL